MNTKTKIQIILMLSCFLGTQATPFQPISLRDLSVYADRIVQAKVTDILCVWNDDSTQINSFIRMHVIRNIIGGFDDKDLIVMQPSGVIGGPEMPAINAPSFKIGEESILFLRPLPGRRQIYVIMGLGQGNYPVTEDTTNIQRVRQNQANHCAVFNPMNDASGTGSDSTVEAFIQTVIQLRTEP
jgi:hypothetical protein